VEIDGTSVTRASLFNKDEIDRLDIGVGDVIVVEKAGKIIPHVVRVEHEQRPPWVERFVFPEVCPTCGSPALQDTGGVYIRCIASATCPDQLKAALVTFGERAHMYIDGLGPDLVEKLVDNKIVENLVQLYDILHKWQQFEQLPGVGKKKFERLVAGLEASKAQPLERWLSGLNIRHIGKSTAAQLVRRFGTIWEIVGATDEELRAVPGFGAASLQALKQFLDSPASCRIIAGLLDHGLTVGEAVPADRPVGALDGLSVVVTGELVNYTREQAQKAVRDAGGNPSSGVSAKTAFLVVGSAAGRVKLDKARTLGIEQIDEAEFTRRLQGATYG
jgi:DNA ligase (NAD+)